MKRIISVFLALVFVFSLTGCTSLIPSPNSEIADKSASDTPTVSDSNAPQEPLSGSTSEGSAAYEITDSRAVLWIDSIGTQWVQTIVEISNTGSEALYLGSGSYDLEDSAGNLIASQSLVSSYPNILAPGEKGYMYEETTLDKDVEGELTVIPHENVEEAKVDLIRLPVSDTELSDGTYGGVKMLGRVENDTDEAQSMVYIVAFLFDDSGVCIGELFTILMDDLAAGDQIGFEMSSFSLPDSITTASVAEYVVYAFPYQYQF